MEQKACRSALIAAVILSLSSAVFAQDRDWRPIGIQGGVVQRLAVDPATSTTIYAATNGGGVFKSTAGGAAWKSIRAGLEEEATAVDALAVDPTDPERIFVAFRSRRLYRSEEGGASWEKIGDNFFTDSIHDIAVAPDGTVYAAARCIARSSDAGTTWTLLDDACSGGSALAVDPADSATVYAAIQSPPGVLVTRDGGETWETTALAGDRVRTLAVDPSSSEVVYASSFDAVYRSRDGGRTFPAVLQRTSELFYDAIVDPGGSGTAYVATNRRVLRSVDGGGTWEPWGAPAPQPPRRLAQTIDGGFFAGTQCGIFRTGQGGGPWRASSGNLLATEIRSLAADAALPGFLFAGTDKCGRFRSVDGGVTWRKLPGPRSSQQTFDLAIDPAEPRRIYAATGGGLFRSLDRGATWSGPDRGIEGPGAPGGVLFNLVRVAPTAAEQIYVVRRGVLHRTTDRGATWARLELDTVSGSSSGVSWVTVDPSDASRVYAVKGPSLLATRDGARTWRRLEQEGLRGPLVVDPAEPDTLYARSPNGAGWEVSKSVDGGETWTVESDGLGETIESLEIDPRDPSTLYAGATRSGFYVSRDGASSWQPLGQAEDFALARALEATGSALYAGMRRGLLAFPGVCDEELELGDEVHSISGVDAKSHRLNVAADAAGNLFATFHAPFGGAAFGTRDAGDRFPTFSRLGGKILDQSPAAAADGPGEVLVAWRHDASRTRQEILLERYRVNGERRGETVEIDSGPRIQEPRSVFYNYATLDVARSRSGLAVVVWSSLSPSGKALLHARRLTATGKPLGDPIPVRGGVERLLAPAAAMDAYGRFTVAWYEESGADDLPSIRMRSFRRNGAPRSDTMILGTPLTVLAPLSTDVFPAAAPALAVAPTGETVVAWTEGESREDEQIVARWFDASGEQAGEHRFVPGTLPFAYSFDVAVDRFGHTLLVWQGGENHNILARAFDMRGQPTSPVTMVDEFGHNEGLPSVAFDLTGRGVVAWRRFEEIAQYRRVRFGCSDAPGSSR